MYSWSFFKSSFFWRVVHDTHHTTPHARTYRERHTPHANIIYIQSVVDGYIHTWRTGEKRLIGLDTYLTGSTLGKTAQKGGVEEDERRERKMLQRRCCTMMMCTATLDFFAFWPACSLLVMRWRGSGANSWLCGAGSCITALRP